MPSRKSTRRNARPRTRATRESIRRFRITGLEQLEDRRLLAIVWVNRGVPGSDTDNFAATYGGDAAVARSIVDHAIDDWNQIIRDFDYDDDDDPTTDNSFALTVTAADLGGGSRGRANNLMVDGNGLPFSATITMDDAGGNGGWFLDPTPLDDDEFTDITNPFQADSSEAGNDFYRTFVHEVGHAVGILTGGGLAINNFLTPAGTDQVDGMADLNIFQNPMGQYGVSATLTDNGGGHLYEGPVDPMFPAAPITVNDLMNPGRTVGPPATRQLVTDLNAQILADAYGYDIVLPSQLNVFIEPDAHETNNTIPTATVLGSLPQVTVQDLSIFESGDVDWFKITANQTGKMIVTAHFLHFDDNDIDMRIHDVNGDILATSSSVTDNESITIPVVTQQDYYIQVNGFNGSINNYDLEIENFAAPVPNAIWLDPTDDTGMMNNDNVTNEDEARVFIEADLTEFNDMGISVLTSADVAAGESGAAVEVIVNGVAVGFADVVPATNNTIFEYTFSAGQLSTTFIPAGGGGGLNAIKAAVRIFDALPIPETARSEESEPLMLTLDQTPPATVPALLVSSDSGMINNDHVTNKMQPAFNGTTEANAKVRVLANGVTVGSGVATSTGDWEITVEPLIDGAYTITAVTEDLAGNINTSAALVPDLVVDTVEPNTPLLDLLNDNGHTLTDNITGFNRLEFLMVGNDTTDGNGNPFPNDISYRLYWRPGDGTGEVLVYDSFTELAGFTTLGQLTRTVTQDLNNPAGTPFPDGVNNFKLEIEDRSGNISHDFILDVLIDSILPDPGMVDLIDSSDSGMFDDDDVTNKMQPAFNGISEVGATVTLFAQEVDAAGVPIADNSVVGTGVVGSDSTDSVPDDGMGIWEITSEPLDDGSYNVTAMIEDWAGGVVLTDPLRIWIDTTQPNTPRLDLLSASDSGRNDTDNITNVTRPMMSIHANDTIDGLGNLLPNGMKYRLYVRPDGDLAAAETLIIDSFAAVGDFVTDGVFTHTVTLDLNDPNGTVFPDGIHNYKLEIEDRAGNLSEHFLMDVEFDTVAPEKSFGEPGVLTDGLHPESDSGLPGQQATLNDRITNDATPTFWGLAEANSFVEARLQSNNAFLGETVAIPFDGNDAFPNGRWELTSTLDLTTIAGGADGGLRTIVITAEDVAGNASVEMTLDILVDVVGPRVNGVFVTDDLNYALFDPKPSVDGPTPLVNALSVVFTDLPNRDPNFLYAAVNEILVEQGGNIDVIGDHVGQVVIDSIQVTIDDRVALPPVVWAQVNFAEPLPDDRYTIIVHDEVRDDAGNRLDGDHLTADPRGGGAFPSGDGQAGGDFVARFTVDSRPEIGTWAGGSVYIDANGNFFFDPENSDDVNEDLVFEFGFSSDDIFAGNFIEAPNGIADGFDKLAAYGDISQPSNSTGFRWLIDIDNNGVPDLVEPDPANVNGLPFAGRFDNNDVNGDEVGLFDGQTFYFDTTHNFQVDTNLNSQLRGHPIAGDFDRDGFDDLGTYNEQEDRFEFDLTNGARLGFDGVIDALVYTGFAGVRERPVAADLDVDGYDDFGLWVPDRSGVTPDTDGEWYIFVSGGNSLLNRIENDQFGNPTISFTPDPFGNDIFAQFGDEFALPVLGNFDPPATITATNRTNLENPLDVNADNVVSPLDALMVINELNVDHVTPTGSYYPDTNGDGEVSPLDALMVINALNESADLLQTVTLAAPQALQAAMAVDEDDDDQTTELDGVIDRLVFDWLDDEDDESPSWRKNVAI